jgi:hypothetical protein
MTAAFFLFKFPETIYLRKSDKQYTLEHILVFMTS